MNRSRGLVFGVLCLIGANIFIWVTLFAKDVSRELTVAFLDIGQGDAIFIKAPNGHELLVDGGPPDGAVLRALGEVMPFSDRSIDIVLATHPDQDHIGGLPEVLNRFSVGAFIESGNKKESAVLDAILSQVDEKSIEHVVARRGVRIALSSDVFFDILFPDRDVSDLESNAASIVGMLTYGDTTFLLTGDSPSAIEKYLISLDASRLDADVLKLGHHGSRTSSSPEFLAAVSPEYAIVSAGEDNSYGHPHKEVIETAEKSGAKILSTINEGTIVFSSDGKTLSYK